MNSITLLAYVKAPPAYKQEDAQLEIWQLCELMFPHLEAWAPEIAAWYKATRYGKARLAP